MLRWVGILFVLVLLGAGGTFWFVCPCETIPGGPLAGERAPAAVTDWSFVNEVGLCQVEVDRVIPWSINLNCMSSSGRLFISCSRCDGKAWSAAALENPEGYIRVRETVYPVRLTRLVDSEALDTAWAARVEKLGLDPGTQRPGHWWSFQLESRNI